MSLLDAIAREAETFGAEFYEAATWTPAGGSATAIRGIFDRSSDVQDIGAMIEMDGVAAMLNVPTVSVPGVARGDAITVRSISYKVVGLEPDGTGRTILVLGI